MTWLDLTVEDADALRDYYAAVCGWTVEPVSMGDYDDYTVKDASSAAVGGICHARGPNTGIPPGWSALSTKPRPEDRWSALNPGVVARARHRCG